MKMDISEDLKKAFRLADVADEIGRKYYLSRELHVTTKPNNTPVTQADTEIEAELNRIVAEEFGDSYIGEEGAKTSANNRRWLVDPIDGTKNFLRGMPVWGSLISLKDGSEVVAACVSAPALGRRWWATKDGAYTKDVDGSARRISVSGIEKLEDSFLLHGNFNSYQEVGIDPQKVFELMRSAYRHRAPGDFLGYLLVAEGACDAFVEVPSALWDLEACKFILEQAGGKVYSIPDDYETVKQQRFVVATNSLLEKTILDYLEIKS